jgi:hypothetical protein
MKFSDVECGNYVATMLRNSVLTDSRQHPTGQGHKSGPPIDAESSFGRLSVNSFSRTQRSLKSTIFIEKQTPDHSPVRSIDTQPARSPNTTVKKEIT